MMGLGCALDVEILKVPLMIQEYGQGVEPMTTDYKLSSTHSILQTTFLD